MSDLITRAFTVRADPEAAEASREVVGLAVPYGQIIEMYDYEHGTEYERFESGSVEPHPDGHMYFYGHGEPIGLVLDGRNTDAGYEIRARISATARGDEVYTLLQDGVLTKHSIGFVPVDARVDQVRLTEDGPEVSVLTRTKVYARETSVVPFPAYDKAAVTEVRDRQPKEPTMPDTLTRDDLAAIETQLTEFDRRLAVIGDGANDRAAEPLRFRSYGEFLKGLADGSSRDDVEAMNRAYTGAVTGDAYGHNTFIDRDIKLVENLRPIFNLFNADPLPAEGMVIEYPKFKAKTGDVAKQAAEGDDLTYMELQTEAGTASVGTYGAYAELTRQTIERRSASYLSKVVRMQAISYAKNTNSMVRTALTGATGTNTAIDISAATLTAAKTWTGAVIDAVGNIETNSLGLGLDFIIAGTAHFKLLNEVVDGNDRPLFVMNGDGSNTIGNLSVKGLAANIAGIPIIVDPGLTGKNMYGCSAEALTLMESPGAPFQLEDENIINLSKAFSVYGYATTTLDDAKGIQPIKVIV